MLESVGHQFHYQQSKRMRSIGFERVDLDGWSDLRVVSGPQCFLKLCAQIPDIGRDMDRW
jgi:hypothetical protein